MPFLCVFSPKILRWLLSAISICSTVQYEGFPLILFRCALLFAFALVHFYCARFHFRIRDTYSLRSFFIGEIIVRALFPWLCICASHGRRSSAGRSSPMTCRSSSFGDCSREFFASSSNAMRLCSRRLFNSVCSLHVSFLNESGVYCCLGVPVLQLFFCAICIFDF